MYWLKTVYIHIVSIVIYCVYIYICRYMYLQDWMIPPYPLVMQHNYWKWSIDSWFTHLKIVMFHSYVGLPKGIWLKNISDGKYGENVVNILLICDIPPIFVISDINILVLPVSMDCLVQHMLNHAETLAISVETDESHTFSVLFECLKSHMCWKITILAAEPPKGPVECDSSPACCSSSGGWALT